MNETIQFKVDFTFSDYFENTRVIMESPIIGNKLIVDSADVGRMDIVAIWLLASEASEC